MGPAEEGRQKEESLYLHLVRFLVRSHELLNPHYVRSAIGAERPIILVIRYY